MTSFELFEILNTSEWDTNAKIVNADLRLNGMKFFIAGQDYYSNRILYLANANNFEDALKCLADSNCSILCYSNESQHLDNLNTTCNCYFVNIQGKDPTDLFLFLESKFFSRLEKQFKTEDLFDDFLNDGGIASLVLESAEVFGNPIWVTDTNYKYLAMHFPGNSTNELISSEYSKGYMNIRSIDAILSSNIYEKVSKSNDPVYFKIDGYSHGFLSCALKAKNDIVGFVTMYELNNMIPQKHYRFFVRLSKILALEIQKSYYEMSYNKSSFSSFMNDLLSGRFKDFKHQTIEKRLARMGYKLHSNMYIMVLVPKSSNGYKIPPHFIVDRINLMLGNTTSCFYNHQPVFLISTKRDRCIPEHIEETFTTYLNDCNLVAGISNVYDNIIDTPAFFNQAVKAAELSLFMRSNETVSFYSRYIIPHMLQHTANNIDLKSLYILPLKKLKEYDEQKGLNLYKTLETYLACNCNNILAAEKLFIHKNTMYHRIEQIKEITHLDLSDFTTLISLYFSFAVNDYLKAGESSVIDGLD